MAQCITRLFTSGIYGFWAKDDRLVRKARRLHLFSKALDQVAGKYKPYLNNMRREAVDRTVLESLQHGLFGKSWFLNQLLLGSSDDMFSNPDSDPNGWEPISFTLVVLALTVFLIEIIFF